MGGGNSKSEKNIYKSENNIYTINKSTINELNETIQNNTQSAITDIINANTIQATAENIVKLKGLKIRTKGNFDIKQGNESAVVFTVENIINIVAELQADITNTITNYLKDNLTTDIESDLVNNAVEKINNGFLSTKDALQFGNTSSTENLQETVNNIKTENNIEKNIQNIVKLCVDTTINNSIVNQCISNIGNYNEVDIEDSDMDIGDNFIIDQSNIINIAVDCINNIHIVESITNKLLQITDITVVNDVDNKEKEKTTQTSEKTENNEGIGDASSKIIDSTTQGISGIVSNVGESISNIFSSSIGIFIVIGVVAIILLIAVAYALTNENTSKNIMATKDLVATVHPAAAATNLLKK